MEIDEGVSRVCKEWFPEDVLFDNNKLKWIYQDAIEWVKDNQSTKVNEYDVCIIDSTDPTIGISIGLFSVDFYNNLKCLLKEGTIISQQCDTQE